MRIMCLCVCERIGEGWDFFVSSIRLIWLVKILGNQYSFFYFIIMTNLEKDIQEFKSLLESDKHYSEALVNLLIKKLNSNQITTFQEINDLIYKDTSAIIQHFCDNPDELSLIESKNPLCLESMRDYLLKLFRVVARMYGKEITKFIQGLKIAFKNQLTVISNLTSKTAQIGYNFLLQHQFKSILVYNYSKSISIALKQLSKQLNQNLDVYVCCSGLSGEGEKMFNDLMIGGVNAMLIADAQSGFYINQVDCILTGAEVVMDDGSIINRSGTALISSYAAQVKTPVIVFAETYKFIKKILVTQKDIPSYARYDRNRKHPIILSDLTKGTHVTMFCTDIGCLTPESVSPRMSSLLIE